VGVTTTSLNASDLVAPGETNTPQSRTDRILGALTVTSEDGEKRLLLGVAWVSAEAWGIDVAFGTNSEQRPLVSGTTKLSTNQTKTHFHAFLPFHARWAYKWTFGTAMPLLLRKQALERNNAFCTDAEENMCGPIVVLSQPGQVWEGSIHGFCIFHLVDRQHGPARKTVLLTRWRLETALSEQTAGSRQDEDGEGRKELIATIDITEATSQHVEEFRRAMIGGGP
jgi:hypothetical protein